MTSAEHDVREFARQFPTPQVQRMCALCETGKISWTDAAELARKALAAGLKAIR